MKKYWIYIMASKRNGTLYTGITGNLLARIWQYKRGLVEGFSKKHHVTRLVYYEEYDDVSLAIWREKRIKRWNRRWKIKIIESINPSWDDLYNNFIDS